MLFIFKFSLWKFIRNWLTENLSYTVSYTIEGTKENEAALKQFSVLGQIDGWQGKHSSFPQQLTPSPPGGSPGGHWYTGEIKSLQSSLGLPRGFLPAGHARGGTGASSLSRSVSLALCG